ncbi:PadR family transcriptional regulator [Candidatus Chloroploca sp. Khr17]|uniref:PadR family transcriptional regulator n=1 Tax=Candidatus Chloroploca sp. Khr17 TaxID=2496869 RepID=UPI00101D020C|nr:PadR family transcriptional regulator [Candidatus Chloroploca sp. Khr17]
MSPMVKLPLSMEYALLGFLRDGQSYPYEVHQRLKQTAILHLVWHLKQRQTYALLDRLQAEGFLESTTLEQGRRPPRRMLRLTSHGMAAFQQWVTLPVEHGREFRQQFMAKLYFAQKEDPATVALLIARQIDACQGWLAEFQLQLGTIPASELLDRLVIQFRIGQLEAILIWLDQCATVLDPIAPH